MTFWLRISVTKSWTREQLAPTTLPRKSSMTTKVELWSKLMRSMVCRTVVFLGNRLSTTNWLQALTAGQEGTLPHVIVIWRWLAPKFCHQIRPLKNCRKTRLKSWNAFCKTTGSKMSWCVSDWGRNRYRKPLRTRSAKWTGEVKPSTRNPKCLALLGACTSTTRRTQYLTAKWELSPKPWTFAPKELLNVTSS